MLVRNHVYQAEESGGEGGQTAPPVLDEAKITELIRQSQKDSIKAALAEHQQTQPQQAPQQAPQGSTEEPDVWDQILEPKLARERQAAARANFQALAADDKAEFYSSDQWTEEVDTWLEYEDAKELKTAKAELRKKIEGQFTKLANEGRPLPRSDIAKHVLMEHISENRTKYDETKDRKRKRTEQAELDKAKRGVDIQAGNLFSVDVADIAAMPFEKIHEKYGSLTF